MARREKNEKIGISLSFLPGILVAVLAVVLAGTLLAAVRRSRTETGDGKSPGTEQGIVDRENEEKGKTEKWQEGVISYQGKNYRYNQNIRTYLLMGIDREGPAAEAEDKVSGGQSDAMFLVVLDAGEKELSVISINRNTMTKISVSDAYGLNQDETVAQICTQHGFGDGMHLSSKMAADTVSYLFYNIPVSGYISMNMGAMSKMNDAIGGVEVEVLQDIKEPDYGVDLKKGEVVTLKGNEAYCYLRSRDLDKFDSATDRLRRQEQFISGFLKKGKETMANDTAEVLKIYDDISDYLVTNIDFVNLVSELMAYDYEESRMYTVPGETVMGERFEEYYPDEEALYDLIIRVFYQEV